VKSARTWSRRPFSAVLLDLDEGNDLSQFIGPLDASRWLNFQERIFFAEGDFRKWWQSVCLQQTGTEPVKRIESNPKRIARLGIQAECTLAGIEARGGIEPPTRGFSVYLPFNTSTLRHFVRPRQDCRNRHISRHRRDRLEDVRKQVERDQDANPFNRQADGRKNRRH
jgi:hypothetical protein